MPRIHAFPSKPTPQSRAFAAIPWLFFQHPRIPIPWVERVFRIPYNLKEYAFSQWLFFQHPIYPWERTDSGGKESHKGRQTIFFTPLNPFGGDSDEEEPLDDYTISQKVHYHSHWKHNHWIKLSWAQDQGLQFRQTQSHAIIVHSPVPAGGIYRVISRNGDRILVERFNPHDPRRKPHWKAIGIRSSSSLFVMMCRLAQGNLCGRANLGQETSKATQRMIRLVYKESCTGSWATCWENATIRNWSSSRRVISTCYLTRWGENERNQWKVGKV